MSYQNSTLLRGTNKLSPSVEARCGVDNDGDVETDLLLATNNDSCHHTPTASEPLTNWIKRSLITAVPIMGFVCLLASLLVMTRNKVYFPTIATSATVALGHVAGDKSQSQQEDAVTTDNSKSQLPMPSGVNFGSWLSLEDYFYVGPTGAVEVATPDQNTVGVCLPPLHVGQLGAPSWQAETDLLANLIETVGIAHAIKIFHAHRTSYVTEHDWKQLSRWGVKHIRVPISWCFTDAHPDDINMTRTDEAYSNQLVQQFTCPDPFYSDAHQTVLWPAISRSTVTQLLRLCAKYGITASLDLHTYPGATSPGTFSGLWPRPPRFWQHDDPQSTGDRGRQLLQDFLSWMETLADTDPTAFAGLRGISPMNEPAHLAGLFRHTDRDYLPPLPRDQADAYLKQLNGKDSSVKDSIPDGPHLRVLRWLQDATDMFRSSALPGLGKQLHLNVHESFLSPEVVRKDINDDNDGKQRHELIAAWWSKATTHKERKSWAVLDMHHYHAWDTNCMGASDGPPAGNYTCGNAESRTETLARCTKWASMFRKVVNKHCGEGAQLMSGEFSTSTHHRVRHACNDIDTLQASYLAQVQTAQTSNVEMYYWSYKMPFGGAFKTAWSFSQLMYLLGVSDRPDQSTYNCGEHVSHPLEVTDDIFG